MTTYEAPTSPGQSSFNDDDDDSHKCRRCDLPILEGHAYELGGDRWHMYCFSCSKCSKLLGTSSNFLVLGTGDLICSDCSYACNACGKKIDDLAILTGDQAYCSTCFCCRNCKKRIEDLKYARTSKGLFCMSCHEKLLEKKRKHDKEKRLNQRASRPVNPEKSLPKVPQDYSSHSSEEPFRVMSPETAVSDESASGAMDYITTTTISTPEIPLRSPERIAIQPSPQVAENTRILDPPVAVSPMKFPAHLSPLIGDDQFDQTQNFSERSRSVHGTPQRQYLGILTPERSLARSPLRQTILTPSDKNRQAVVVGDISSSSSNILSSYIKDSPPPTVPPPKIPDEDFIDMSDSDEDVTKYNIKPPGFSEIRHSESIPAGLNIQGLPSFDEHFDNEVQAEIKQEGVNKDLASPRTNGTYDEGEKENEGEGFGSTKSWKTSFMSPNATNKKLAHLSDTSQVQRSRSIRSPKNFLNFRKHKKTTSSSSVENYKISSPIPEYGKTFEDGNLNVRTPRVTQETSPYQGAALFSTPPLPSHGHISNQRKHSVHGRSRSDANVTESHDIVNSELELRSLRMEIRDLKTTKHSVLKEVTDLTSQRDELNLEIVQLQSKLDQLKIQLQGQSSKSSVDEINDATPFSLVSNTGPPHSASTSGSTPTVETVEHIHVDPKQKTSKTRFWKRFGKNDGMISSQSAYSISNILNDGGAKSGNPQISAPMLRTEEADELGGNDNKKLLNTKGYNLENANSSQSVVTNSSSSALIMSDLFNSSLVMRASYEKRPIPLIVSRLISEVEKRGLDSEGIYRKNGATSQMNAIFKAFNNLYQAETSQELENALSNCDVNALTSSLKRYLYYHLPEPIITMQVYEEYISIAKFTDEQDKIDALAHVVEQLPKANARVLVSMLTHLKKVDSYSHLNKMNFYNLAVVFAPTFSRVSDGERELMDMTPRNNVTEFLLMRQDEIFGRLQEELE